MTIYYPRSLFAGDFHKHDKERDRFYDMLKQVQDTAIDKEVSQGPFYLTIIYKMEDGTTVKYTEDNDYMIPYSLEFEEKRGE